MLEELRSTLRYWMVVRFLKMVARYYSLDLEKTKVWRELHTPYNPIVALGIAETFFEESYLRTPLMSFKDRNKRMFFYMHRMGDISHKDYVSVFVSLTDSEKKKLYKSMGMSSHSDMIFFTVGYWSSNNEEENFIYRDTD